MKTLFRILSTLPVVITFFLGGCGTTVTVNTTLPTTQETSKVTPSTLVTAEVDTGTSIDAIIEITEYELMNLAMEASKTDTDISDIYHKNLNGIVQGQIIRVRGKIASMHYYEKPSGDVFYIYFEPKGSKGDIELYFTGIGAMRAKELILNNAINEGDEVIIQGEYDYYKISRSDNDEWLRIKLDHCSIVN